MCWVALDRAIALAKELKAGDRVTRWMQTRDEIRSAILERGFSERARASFPQAFSHIGLVNAAWAIAQAEGSADS